MFRSSPDIVPDSAGCPRQLWWPTLISGLRQTAKLARPPPRWWSRWWWYTAGSRIDDGVDVDHLPGDSFAHSFPDAEQYVYGDIPRSLAGRDLLAGSSPAANGLEFFFFRRPWTRTESQELDLGASEIPESGSAFSDPECPKRNDRNGNFPEPLLQQLPAAAEEAGGPTRGVLKKTREEGAGSTDRRRQT